MASNYDGGRYPLLVDQSFLLHVVFFLVDEIKRHLEPLAERNRNELQIVIVEINGANEFGDVNNPEIVLCHIINHDHHPPLRWLSTPRR